MNTNVTLIGNIVAEPEVRVGANGKEWMSFPLYVNEPATEYNPQGHTSKYQCRLFNGIVPSAKRILTSGLPVMVYGEIKTEEFSRKDGSKGQSTTIRVISVAVNTIGIQSLERTAPKTQPEPTVNEDPFADQ